MAKGTILDRLAGAMKTLGKREGKALTPKQRVAAAQRWNSLADIGEDYIDNFAWKLSNDEAKRWHDAVKDANQIGILEGQMYNYRRADNPFLSENIDKYAEQSDFLDWCRYNRVRPEPMALKQFRWETYLLNSPGNVGTKYRTIDEFPDYLEPGEVLNLDYMRRY